MLPNSSVGKRLWSKVGVLIIQSEAPSSKQFSLCKIELISGLDFAPNIKPQFVTDWEKNIPFSVPGPSARSRSSNRSSTSTNVRVSVFNFC